MIFVGIDVGKFFHCAAAINGDGKPCMKPTKVKQDFPGFESLQKKLENLGGVPDIKIGLEASGHYWKLLWRFLLGQGWDVAVFNPVLSSQSARTHLRGRKTDADDAVVIAKVVRDGGFQPLHTDSEQMEEMKTLCRQRRFIVCETANAKRRLTALLDQSFPEFVEHFSDPMGNSALAILEEAQGAREVATLNLVHLAHILKENSSGHFGMDKAKALRESARKSLALVQGQTGTEACVRIMVEQLRFFDNQVHALDARIGELFDSLDHPIKSIPGIGRVTAPVILSEIGNIERFKGNTAKKVLAYAGLDPRVRESGQWHGKTKMSKRGSPMLRTALFQAASMGRLHEPALAAIYHRQRVEFKKHHGVAISHVARKLVQIICAVWKNGDPFDRTKLLKKSA